MFRTALASTLAALGLAASAHAGNIQVYAQIRPSYQPQPNQISRYQPYGYPGYGYQAPYQAYRYQVYPYSLYQQAPQYQQYPTYQPYQGYQAYQNPPMPVERHRDFDVQVRRCDHEPWQTYRKVCSRDEADELAHQLHHQGYETRVRRCGD